MKNLKRILDLDVVYDRIKNKLLKKREEKIKLRTYYLVNVCQIETFDCFGHYFANVAA